jgi:flavin reductase (DIM6/NTAB) family NADH-FMN oxidoreductase RutF
MIEPGIYKDVMGSFPSGVTVVTTLDPQGGIVGITASAFSALSIEPALVLFCPNYASDTYPVLRDSMHLPARARTRPKASTGT